MAATAERGDFLACSAKMGVPTIGEIVAGYAHSISQGFSANISLLPPGEVGTMVIISPRLMVSSSMSVAGDEVRALSTAMANAGQKIYNDAARMTGVYPNPQTISRLTVATTSAGGIYCGLRVTAPTAYRLAELVEKRRTISPLLAEFLVLALQHSPGVVMAICGPGGSGKSTLLNALLYELVARTASRMPSTVVFPGDAMDVVAPSGVTILPALSGDAAVTVLKSANARTVFVGEIVSREMLEVYLASRGAFRSLATTVHGDIERASRFMPASMYAEMAVLGTTYVVARVAVSIAEAFPALHWEGVRGQREITLRTVDGEKSFTIVGEFNPLSGKFWHDAELLAGLVNYLKHIGESY